MKILGGTLEIPRNLAEFPQKFREILGNPGGIMDLGEIWGPAGDPPEFLESSMGIY